MIIIIDDNKDLVGTFCKILELWGYDVASANSGEEGIEKIKELNPKVILCDIGMDGMDGYDVARYVKGDKDLKDIYMIAISGYNGIQDRKLSEEAGFDMHMGKPIEFDILTKTLNELVG